jgi:hypothetical protein
VACESLDRALISSGPFEVSSSSEALRVSEVAFQGGGFGAARSLSALAVSSVAIVRASVGSVDSEEPILLPTIFLPKSVGGVVAFESHGAEAGSRLSSEAKSGELPVYGPRTVRFSRSKVHDSARRQVGVRALLLQRVPGTLEASRKGNSGSITLRRSLVAFEPPGSKRRGLQAVAVPSTKIRRPTQALKSDG